MHDWIRCLCLYVAIHYTINYNPEGALNVDLFTTKWAGWYFSFNYWLQWTTYSWGQNTERAKMHWEYGTWHNLMPSFISHMSSTVKPRYNELLCNEIFNLTNYWSFYYLMSVEHHTLSYNYTYSTENKTCEMALLACLVQHCLQSIK